MISVTSLSEYTYCPRKLYLQRVLKIFELPKAAVAAGTVRHEVYDKINKTDKEIVLKIKERLGLQGIVGLYKKVYSKILREVIKKNMPSLKEAGIDSLELFKKTWPLILKESETRAGNVYGFMKEHGVLGEELWLKLTPKMESELKIKSEKLQLTGVIDQLEIYQEEVVPVELKTGKTPNDGVWPGHKIQLGAYALLLEEERGKKVKYGKVRYLDSDDDRKVVINPFLYEEVKELTKKVICLLQADKVPNICVNCNKCASCGLKDKCHDQEFIKNRAKELLKA